MRLVILSDTHNKLGKILVPAGDLLIHCGDFTSSGKREEVAAFNDELAKLPHKYKVVIAGNHDRCMEQGDASEFLPAATHYLLDRACTIEGIKLYGSPWQPEHRNMAFNLPRQSEALKEKWAAIPDDIDVLITHGPAYGFRDKTWDGRRVGCEVLQRRLFEVNPKVHCFGHIHEGHGIEKHENIFLVNASICNARNEASNPAVVLDWKDGVFRHVTREELIAESFAHCR